MIREIKLRAWDNELEIMVYDNEETNYLEYETNPIDAVNATINQEYPEYEWMQYTGLHDSTEWEELAENERNKFLSSWNFNKDRKNAKEDWKGKEIYEGDIICFFHDKLMENKEDEFCEGMGAYEKYTRNYAVEFVNTYCTYGLRARNKSIHFKLSQATINTHNAKVIGNIYENIALLKEGENE